MIFFSLPVPIIFAFGKSLASYAFISPELFPWLDRHPLVEFQGIKHVFSPVNIGLNPQFVVIIPVRKVDLSGRIVLNTAVSKCSNRPDETAGFF
jgi:hypothetical protein